MANESSLAIVPTLQTFEMIDQYKQKASQLLKLAAQHLIHKTVSEKLNNFRISSAKLIGSLRELELRPQ